MKAQFVFERFEEVSDPIHDLGIGDPLMRAGAKMQRYAENHGYEFQLEKIAKTESPVMYVPIKPFFEKRTGFQGGGATYTTKLKFTITYIKGQPKPLSLRKVFMGNVYVPTDEDFYRMKEKQLMRTEWEKWQIDKLKKEMKKGPMKERPLKQALLGRFSEKEAEDVIKRMDKTIKNINKK